MGQPLLEVRGMEVRYGAIEAVRGLNFAINEGTITTIIGANGAGKSTTLMALSRILPLAGGSIYFAGSDITGVSASDVVGRGLVQVPEGRRVFPRMTVRENLKMGAFLVSDAAVRDEREAYVLELFPRLQERYQQQAGTLSGGEQQMLALGRALMAGPRLLLLDEPSLGLAPIIVQAIFERLKAINAEGCTILLVEQNAHMALTISQYAYVLESGSLVHQGESAAMLKDPAILEHYLGG